MLTSHITFLRCPTCRATLTSLQPSSSPSLPAECILRCTGCHANWPVHDSLPHLFIEENVRGSDRLMRTVYDKLALLHDPLTALLSPIIRVPLEPGGAHPYLRRIDLAGLANSSSAPALDRPFRILDIGIGTGADLPLLLEALPANTPVEIWGMDLSRGMLSLCRNRVKSLSDPSAQRSVHLLFADAHALPFADSSFDRVFHVGAMNSYRDPRLALSEMARVAIAGTPIVVVDEQLDPKQSHNLAQRALFRFLTFYDSSPRCPRDLLPPNATDILEEQASRYYYVLTFKTPLNTPQNSVINTP